MRETDRDYYLARALAERARSEAADDPSARAIHLALALRYEAAARGEIDPATGTDEIAGDSADAG